MKKLLVVLIGSLAFVLASAHADDKGGRILQINFKYNVPRAEYEKAVAPMADPISKVDGLKWKVWILNEKESESSGVYLFESEAAANAYLQGPLVAQITSHPALSSFVVKQFDVMPDVTKVTKGPVK
jgi:hypothetical protein